MAYKSFPLSSIYSATKAAVRNLTQSFALELAKEKITVNAYAPGFVDTAMNGIALDHLSEANGLSKEENLRSFESQIALGRIGVPEDVAKIVSFLASPDSDYVTGQTMLVDGGIHFN